MKLEIKGNLVELERSIEGFTKNKKAELESRLHRATIKSATLATIAFVFSLCAVLFAVLRIKLFFNLSLFIMCIMFFSAFVYTLFTQENKIDVEAETKQAVRDMYGDRAFLLDCYHLGRILSVVIDSLSVIHGQADICLLFECQTDSKTVESHTLKVSLMKSSDINYQGILILDLEYGTGTYYYKDTSVLRYITKSNVEFEVINPFKIDGIA